MRFDMSFASPWMLGVAATIVISVIALLMFRQRRRRRRALERIADELGFTFIPDGDGTLAARLARSPLFPKQGVTAGGRLRTTTYEPGDLLRGKVTNLIIEVFEFSSCIRTHKIGGDNRSISWHSAVLFQFSGPPLPAFEVEPKTWFHLHKFLGTPTGSHSIAFDLRPSFSSKYTLRGDDETSILRIFNDDVINYFEAEPRWITMGGQNHLLFHAPGRVIPPELIRSTVENGIRLLTLLGRLEPGEV